VITTVLINANKQDRDKIAALLSAQDNIKILAQGNDGYDALRLIGSLKPDIVVLDYYMELFEEEDIPPLLRVRSPSTAVVILSSRISDYHLFRAALNEVSGFIHKETDLDYLPLILRCIAQGGCFISPVLAARIIHFFAVMNRKGIERYKAQANRRASKGSGKPGTELKLPFENNCWKAILKNGPETRPAFDGANPSGADPIEHLSKMELRILTCIGEGHASSEIAKNLNLAVGTVRNYISSVMRKTGLHNRSQMVRYACFYGLVPH